MIAALIYFVIYLVIIGLVIWLLVYMVGAIGLPEPIHRVARIAIIVIGTLIVILLLLNLIGAVDVGAPRIIR